VKSAKYMDYLAIAALRDGSLHLISPRSKAQPKCSAVPEVPPKRDRAAGSAGLHQSGQATALQVFVWRNAELSSIVPVRPDGKISTPLVEDMVAVGKTPTQLAS